MGFQGNKEEKLGKGHTKQLGVIVRVPIYSMVTIHS